MDDTGLEDLSEMHENLAFSETGWAESGALCVDPDLEQVIDAWDSLPNSARESILRTIAEHAAELTD